MTTATATIPCPYCLRDPQVEVPVEYHKRADGWVAAFALSHLRLAIIVHRKQHKR